MWAVHFITHPEVAINPLVPVPDWPLSDVGVHRMQVAADQGWLADVRFVSCSAERKARDAARLLAGALRLSPVVIKGLGENDRSATGYLPKREFEDVADAFFARPDESVRGWERAVDAQLRIIGAVEQAIAAAPAAGDMAIISHGGVGALLLCHLKRVPISRDEDQPGDGGGNVFSFDKITRRLRSGWRSIEECSARLALVDALDHSVGGDTPAASRRCRRRLHTSATQADSSSSAPGAAWSGGGCGDLAYDGQAN